MNKDVARIEIGHSIIQGLIFQAEAYPYAHFIYEHPCISLIL